MRNQDTRQAGVADMAAAREARARRQRGLLDQYRVPLVSYTLNIPGPVKNSPLIAEGFDHGAALLENCLRQAGVRVLARQLTRAFTGDELLLACREDPLTLKKWMCGLDGADEFGRLMDLDVLDAAGRKISRGALGFPPRHCLLCGNDAALCAPARAHRAEDLFRRAEEIIRGALRLARARHIGRLAQKSLVTEALVTPKPGLVDQANNGAHQDMDLPLLLHSACALGGYFEGAALTGMRLAGGAAGLVMEALRPLGLQAEADMYEATGGVNTHKGAIYALGILCAAAGRLTEQRLALSPQALFRTAGLIAAREALHLPALAASSNLTSGLRLYAASGVTGARGEAAAGFPGACAALPRLRRYLAEGRSMNDALAFTLIHLMAGAQDTSLMKRAGPVRYQEVLGRVRSLLAAPALSLDDIRRLDQQFISENLSPGGSADLLAAVCLAHWLDEVPFPA